MFVCNYFVVYVVCYFLTNDFLIHLLVCSFIYVTCVCCVILMSAVGCFVICFFHYVFLCWFVCLYV